MPETAAAPSRKVWRHEPRPLDPFFSPRSVAVIGASEKTGSVGNTLAKNLLSVPFGASVYPVNPKHATMLGARCYPDIASLPEKPDLAVIVTPAATVPGLVGDCARAGIKSVVVISAGFKELGAPGEALEKKILDEARGHGVRIIGPNCLGLMNPLTGMNATFAGRTALPGNVAFISQSGALCTAVLDWSLRERVGFSAFVSIGSMIDVGWGDLIDHFGDDPDTHSILIYMESIGNARAFLSAAREVALSKPIIVLKVGRTDQAMRAAMSHTGSIAGSDDVLEAAFRRSGVLRVTEIRDLFYMAEILAKQPRPAGPRLTILTNAGGPGVLATDALILSGGQLAELSEPTKNSLDSFLPPSWSKRNPVDILGDADPDRFARSLDILSKDSQSDGLLAVLTPQAMTDPTRTAQALAPYARSTGKPVLASWMGADEVEQGRRILREAGIPVLPYPDEAARLFDYMWQYSYNLRALYQTPALRDPATAGGVPGQAAARVLIEGARREGRTLLTENESKKLLAAYGIPIVPTEIAETADRAAELADRFGYPVVLKLNSRTITHKTDVGGIRLDLADARAVRQAFTDIQSAVTAKKGREHFQGVSVQPMIRNDGGYELILGSSVDPQFGPVILFGTGGQNVEIFKDCSLALPPLNTTLARRLMERTKIFKAFAGVRGRDPIDIPVIEETLVRFSQIVAEQRRIKEIDINPFFISPGKCVALDARVVLHGPETSDEALPRPAIRPYPSEYAGTHELPGGITVHVRPIRPEDEPLMVRFHESLSEESVRRRYFTDIKLDRRVAHERLVRVCFNDYDRELALVAERRDPRTGAPEILGVGRLSRMPGTDEAEYSAIVSDPYQKKGLGTLLLRLMSDVAGKEGLRRLFAEIQPDNVPMQRVFEKTGFTLIRDEGSGTLKAERLFKREKRPNA